MLETVRTDDPTSIAVQWLAAFSAALEARDAAAVSRLFAAECYWRDLLAFSWNIATFEGRPAIESLVSAADVAPGGWKIDGPARARGDVIEAWLSFETALGRGVGYVRLKDGLCWTLMTSLLELKGFEEPLRRRRPSGLEHKADGRTWLEARRQAERDLGESEQPYVLIVGGGQSGLGLAARLKLLGVPALIVDRHPKPGDQWRSRYSSLVLHDPVWYDHMPYLPFPDHWPVFTPKDKMGDWLEAYAGIMELDIWSSTEWIGAAYDEMAGAWAVDVVRGGTPKTLRPAHLVLAMGTSGKAFVPQFPGAASFKGPQNHSSQHPGGAGFKGKRVVVIGSNNSAHDICADLWEHGAEAVMVQRSSTTVIRSETLMDLGLASLYSEDALDRGVTAEKADLLRASVPLRVLTDMQRLACEEIARRDADLYERLERAGFAHDFGDDGSGLNMKYLRRGSGYYIDVGASDLVADGSIKLKSQVDVDRIVPEGVVLSDGEVLEADAIVYATGYGSMSEWVREKISDEVADRIGHCWGYGSGTRNDPGPWEGELRNMWKPTAQDGLWFHGGNLALGRQYSLYLALQLKARLENLPFKVIASPL